MPVRIGTAAWSIPRACAGAFPPDGPVLARYAQVFDAVEVNSTFYRAHRRATYERWAATVPERFRFAVKVPRSITHEARLRDCADRVATFVDEATALGSKLGPLLLQLPPSLAFDPVTMEDVCGRLGRVAPVVCEPRHPSWFTPEVEGWLAEHQVARVAADPPRGAGGDRPGGWPGLAYHRLHGSPKVYFSAYAIERLTELAKRLAGAGNQDAWCIFDNTALGAATADALTLKRLQSAPRPAAPCSRSRC